MLPAETAILVELETIGIILLVLEGIVISLLALAASQRDLNAHGFNLLRIFTSKTAPFGDTFVKLPQMARFVNEKFRIFRIFF